MTPLPCIACGKTPESVDDDFRNSPYEATAFNTHGHYGSTIFDPMNGCFIEINVCDSCIETAAKAGRVLMGQDFKLVKSHTPDGLGPAVIGRIPVKRELVDWHPGLEHEGEEHLYIEPEEVGSDLYPEIIYHDGILEMYRHAND